MEGGMLEYIILDVIISAVVFLILIKVSNLIGYIRMRHNNTNQNRVRAEYRHPRIDHSIVNRPAMPVSPPSHTAPARTHHNTTNRFGRRESPPPIPTNPTRRRMYPDSYPSCPQCGSNNRNGGPQMIFWDRTNNMWRCQRGHAFES